MQLTKPAAHDGRVSQLISVSSGQQWGDAVVRLQTFLISAALTCSFGCCVSEDAIRATWSEGLVPGAQNVRCEWADGDNSGISFTYELPAAAAAEDAIVALAQQISRSGGKATQPTVTCFEVLKQTPTYLVIACRDKGSRGYGAWEIVLNGRTVTAIAGPPWYVLDHLREPNQT